MKKKKKGTCFWYLFVRAVLFAHLKGYSSRRDVTFTKSSWYIACPEGRKAAIQAPSPSALAEMASSQSGCRTGLMVEGNNGEKVPSGLQRTGLY